MMTEAGKIWESGKVVSGAWVEGCLVPLYKCSVCASVQLREGSCAYCAYRKDIAQHHEEEAQAGII